MASFVAEEQPSEVFAHRFSIAPMMDYTNMHQRQFMRLLTSQTVLYSEMVAASTMSRGDIDNPRFLAQFAVDEPMVLQIGGSDVDHMQATMKMAVDYGYKEVNINCGCPSSRVAGSGSFGASLMFDPDLVSKMVQAMAAVSPNIPITIKCRIGVDDHDSYEQLVEFIELLRTQAGVKHFIVHARKAILNMKLTPAENRSIPPLVYDTVYRLVKDFPNLDFSINGGISTYEEAKEHLAHGVKGIMVGRAAIEDPFYWRHIDSEFYGIPDQGFSRREILKRYGAYGDALEKTDGRVVRGEMMKPLFNLFKRTNCHKKFRHQLEVNGRKEKLFSSALELAIEGIYDKVLDEI